MGYSLEYHKEKKEEESKLSSSLLYEPVKEKKCTIIIHSFIHFLYRLSVEGNEWPMGERWGSL